MILDHESDGRGNQSIGRCARADLPAENDRIEQARAPALECVELVRGRSSERIMRGGTIPPRPYTSSSSGDVAQLGEHRVRIAGVRGSSPLISTTPQTHEDAHADRPG